MSTGGLFVLCLFVCLFFNHHKSKAMCLILLILMIMTMMMMHEVGKGPKHDTLVRKAWLELRIQMGEQRGICGYQKQR